MSDLPTPLTDAQTHDSGDEISPGMYPHSDGDWVPVAFARDLERNMRRLERERDEAIAARKASAADWLNQVEQANARVSRALQQVALAERERDESREAGAVAVLKKLMAERGFRVSRGIGVHPNGEHRPKWAIDRLDAPLWGGVWQPWELNAVPAEDGEPQSLFRLCATALTKWDVDAWMHDFEDERGEEPNTGITQL